MSRKKARFGSNGKAVHYVEQKQGEWGISLCRKWSGLCRLTTDNVNCWKCIQLKRAEEK